MKYTSAQANKLLKQLQEERAGLLTQEAQSRTFTAATTENLEDVRPDYDYKAVQEQLAAVEKRIREVKHAINLFNVTHAPEGFDGMTIDQMLVYLPQLTERRIKLSRMANVLAKTRLPGGNSPLIEYEYANYDLETVRRDLLAVTEELSRAQLALDHYNQTVLMETDL